MAYPTTAELVAASTVDALTTLTAAQQEALRVSSIRAIEEYTGQSFDFQPGVARRLDGNGTLVVYLPVRLETLTTLAVSRSSLTASDVRLTERRDALYTDKSFVASNYYTQALNDMDGNLPNRFTAGVGTVEVTGDWGWPAVPPAVVDAIRIDMEDTALADSMALNETIRAYRKVGMGDVAQGDLRATITGIPALSDEVVGLLRGYVWEGQIGVVA